MDLVGIDVGFEVSKSFYALSFGEPRWRPSTLAARNGRRRPTSGARPAAAGTSTPRAASTAREDPPAPEPAAATGLVVIAGHSALAEELRDAAEAAGWDVATPATPAARCRALVVDCGGADEDEPPLQGGPQVLLCDQAPLAELDPRRARRGLPRAAAARRARRADAQPDHVRRGGRAPPSASSRSLGRHVEWVGDAPGLVLGRIVCQLVNEACFALGDGVGAPDGHRRRAWCSGSTTRAGRSSGATRSASSDVLGVLGGLCEEYREERYRAAPALLRAVRGGEPLRS